MAVNKEKKVLVPLRKGNEQKKVFEEFVNDYLQAGWKKVVIKKGKRDSKTGLFLKGEADEVVLEGIDAPDIATLKAEIVKLKAEIDTLKTPAK